MTVYDIWLILVTCGFVIGLSPSMISVFAGLVAASFGKGFKKSEVASIALAFIETLLIFYIGFMTLAVVLLGNLSQTNLEYFGIYLGLLLVCCGLYNIFLAYFQDTNKGYRRHLSAKTHKQTIKQISIKSTVYAAISTSIRNVTTTLVPLLGVALILIITKNTGVVSVFIYPIALITPLIVVAILSLKNIKLSAVMKWKNDNASTFHAWAGVVTVVLGWFIWLLVNKSVQIIL